MAEDIAVIDVIVQAPSVIEVVVGTAGEAGPPGPPGGSSSVFFYRVDAQSTAPNDPGTGKVKYNTAVQADATALYVDWLTADGFDAHVYFRLLTVTRLAIQDKDLAVNYQVFDITGPVIEYPDWFEVPVAFVSSSGSANFSNNHNVALVLLAEAGATVPTAPLEQTLISQGPGVPPVFSQVLTLATPTPFAPCLSIANHTFGNSWRFSVANDGNLEIRLYNAAGVRVGPGLSMDPYVGGLASFTSGFTAYNGGAQCAWFQGIPNTVANSQKAVGRLVELSDSQSKTPGDVVVGGGTFQVLARWNGTNWIVIGG